MEVRNGFAGESMRDVIQNCRAIWFAASSATNFPTRLRAKRGRWASAKMGEVETAAASSIMPVAFTLSLADLTVNIETSFTMKEGRLTASR